MDYKKIIKSRAVRLKILHMLSFIPDKTMLKIQYRIKTGHRLNLKDPKRFTEKLQWYKLYYRNPVMKQCVNKFQVRDYVKEKGLEDILIPLYAHYDRADDICWEELPEQFVIKTEQGGGGLNVVVCPDKSMLNEQEILQKFRFVPGKTGKNTGGREWAYYEIPKGIVVEQLLVNREIPEAGINDYKFFCYNGVPKYIVADTDRYIGHKRNFYDTQWNNLHITSDCPACDRDIPKPQELDQMLAVAARLSADFPYVRVDLYDVDGKVYFGELTFYPWSGYVQYSPDEYDFEFGEPFPLTKYQAQ